MIRTQKDGNYPVLNDNQESLNFPAGAFFVYKQFKYWGPETPVEAAEESISRVKTEKTLLGYRIDGLIGCDFCAKLGGQRTPGPSAGQAMFAGKVQMCQKWNSSGGDLSKHVQKNTYRASLVLTIFLVVVCHFIHLVHAKTMQPSI